MIDLLQSWFPHKGGVVSSHGGCLFPATATVKWLACASSTAHGQRRKELLKLIKAMPGAPVAEIADEMGISPGQVHGLVRKARAERLIVKQGKGFAVK
jgi:hypothetical protein